MRIGIECGGTFTDYIALDDDGSLVSAGKVFSTPSDPSHAVAVALEILTGRMPAGGELVHGSTVATNSLIERKGARVALIVTAGFRDVIFLQRQDRTTMYDLRYRSPVPIVAREDVFEVHERLDAAGRVVCALDPAELTGLVERLRTNGYEAVAISLLHSYANDQHEQLVAQALGEALPGLHLSLSSEISREFREYERTTTTTIDAFLKPRISAYLLALDLDARARGFVDTQVMQSNGGRVPVGLAASLPLSMLRSGPAAGVAAAVQVAQNAGSRDIVTLDMGGTSTDVAVVRDGRIEMSNELTADGLPVRVSMVDIEAVGAGGGSLVDVDSGGLLTVGPESAGAAPGPAAYGRGGTRPTVTDANVVRGLLRPEAFLGGGHQLDVAAATAAVASVGERMNRSAADLACDITTLVAAHMAGAIRMMTTERGYDVTDYTIVAYGGAGGLHAADVAESLGMRRVLLPPYCGMASAYGLLAADFRREFARTSILGLSDLDDASWRTMQGELERDSRSRMVLEGVDLSGLTTQFSADMRYRGQGYEVMVAAGSSGDVVDTVAELADRFAEVQKRRFGYADVSREAQLVTLRVIFSRPSANLILPRVRQGDRDDPVVRQILDRGKAVDARFVHREALRPGDQLDGAAVIQDDTSTIVVPVGWSASVDIHTNVILERM